MSEWTDDAIVLRLGHFNEAHVWLRVLARQSGLITIFAFGGLKSKRRFCGCLDNFNILSCHVKSSSKGGYYVLQESSLIKAPRKLRSNWRNMGLAANCLGFLQRMEIDAECSAACFMLVERLRDFLEMEENASIFIPHYFRLRLAAVLGFAPQLNQCCKCGRIIQNERGFFMPAEGGIFCQNCTSQLSGHHKSGGMWLDQEVVRHLALVENSQPENWVDGYLARNGRRLCAQAIQAFIDYYFEADHGRNTLRQTI